MKTIGLIGGSTWVSSAEYYKILNRLANQKKGGYHSASIIMQSFNFDDFRTLIEGKRYEEAEQMLTRIAQNLQKAGADCILICANTPHMFAKGIQEHIEIPLIHIAKETGQSIHEQRLKKVALLGTKPTMELEFYAAELKLFGIETIIPEEIERNYIHQTIFEEFSKDVFTPEAKNKYIEIIESLKHKGAEGVILGCTEIPILIQAKDVSIPVFDTMQIHCKAAIDFVIQ